jgi:mitogen-activated protein kinase organizer 1
MAWDPSHPTHHKPIGPAFDDDRDNAARAAAAAAPAPPPPPELPCRLAAELPGHDGPVLAARFSATGAYLVTGGRDRTLRLWNPHRAAAAESAAAAAAAEAAEGGGGGGGGGAVRSGGGGGRQPRSRSPPPPPPSHQPVKVYRGGHGRDVRDVSISADSAQLASVGGDRAIVLWDVATGAVLRRLTGEGGGGGGGAGGGGGGAASAAAFPQPPLAGPIHAVRHHSAAPTLLLTGGADRALRVWDVRARGAAACVQCCRPFADDVSCVAEGPSLAPPPSSSSYGGGASQQLCASSVDGTVAVFDCRRGTLTRDDVAGGLPVTGLHVPEGGLALLAACGDGRARLLDAAGGAMLAEYGPAATRARAADGGRSAGGRRAPSAAPPQQAAAAQTGRRSRWGPPPPGAPPPRARAASSSSSEEEDEEEGGAPPAAALSWVRCATTPPDDGAVVTTSGSALVFWDYATGAEVARVERAAGKRRSGGEGGGGRGEGGGGPSPAVSALAVAPVPRDSELAAVAGFASACCAVTGDTGGGVRVWR